MEFTIKLSEQMLGVVGEALGNAPFKTAAPVIFEIQRQADEQRKQQVPARGANGKETGDALPA